MKTLHTLTSRRSYILLLCITMLGGLGASSFDWNKHVPISDSSNNTSGLANENPLLDNSIGKTKIPNSSNYTISNLDKTRVSTASMDADFLMVDCAALDYNDPTNKAMLAVTATANTSGDINVLIDGNLGNNNFFYPDNAIAGLEVLRVVFPQSEILTGIEYAIGDSYMFNTNATIKIQGSNDGSTWTDMVPVTEGTSPSLVISGNNYTKDRNLGNNHPAVISEAPNTERMFWTNTTQYTNYRILGVSGNTNQNPWVNELYFNTIDGFEVTNLGCTDNGTSENYTDDVLTFDFTPLKGTGTYSVAVDGGFTISPTSGTYGVNTAFTVSSGSSGAGDLNMTFTDSNIPCTQTIVIPNTVNGCLPGPCGVPDWNDPMIKATLTGDFHIPGTGSTDGPLAVFVDSNNGSGAGSKNNNYSNTATFTIDFTEQTVLHGMEVVVSTDGQGGPISSAVMRVEGSNDGTNYVAITSDLTYNTDFSIGAAQYGTGTNAYTFPFAANTTAYQYYRLYAVSMTTQFGPDFQELYFDYDFFDPQITNQSCDDNSTFSDYADDKVTFDLNPTPGTGGNTYTVDVSGGYTITPSTGTFGQVTSFTVSSGSSGSGDLSITLVDSSVPCAQVFVVPNEENACIPGPCGGPDWNVAAIKSTLIGDFHIPGTGATDGPLAVFVDSNNGSGAGSKNNNYSNTATFTIDFAEQTVLHGMEVVVSTDGQGGPISSAVMRVEGSNDGTNYVAITNDLTYNTDFSIGAAQYGTGTNAYTFPFAANTTAYQYYRLYAVSMTTQFGPDFQELYFDYDVFDPALTNISFGDNSTPGIFNDDVVDFDMNPSPGTGTYEVQVLGGYTVTPTTGTYGQVTSFQISEGSAGTGDLDLLVIDAVVPCVQEIIIPNPDLSATVEAVQAACSSPTDSPLAVINITAADGVYTKAEYNIGTVYAGTGFVSAIDITGASSGFEIVNSLPNPEFTSYYTVRAYATETLFRDFVVSIDPKVCSVADLALSVSPITNSANEGEQLTYVVTLSNAGPDPAVNVEIKVDIPAGLELLSTSPGIGDYSVGTQLWTADLVPLGDHELTITYKMK